MRGVTIAVAVLLFGVQAEAGTITQTVPYGRLGDATVANLQPVQSSSLWRCTAERGRDHRYCLWRWHPLTIW